MYRAGTRIFAECTEYSISGALVEDADDLDGLIKVRCDETGLISTLCGWLWDIDVDEPEPFAPADLPALLMGSGALSPSALNLAGDKP